jgi:hypothetical protein
MRRSLCLIACAAGISAGCGDDGESDATPPEVLSGLARGAFVDSADRICVQGRKRLILTWNRYFGDLSRGAKPGDAAVTAFANREAIPILERQYGRLRGLRPPPGDERQIGRILEQAERGISQLRADPTLLNRGSGIPPGLEQAQQGAFEYGLGACGRPIERPAAGNAIAP